MVLLTNVWVSTTYVSVLVFSFYDYWLAPFGWEIKIIIFCYAFLTKGLRYTISLRNEHQQTPFTLKMNFDDDELSVAITMNFSWNFSNLKTRAKSRLNDKEIDV